jgi:hypothetical protein
MSRVGPYVHATWTCIFALKLVAGGRVMSIDQCRPAGHAPSPDQIEAVMRSIVHDDLPQIDIAP